MLIPALLVLLGKRQARLLLERKRQTRTSQSGTSRCQSTLGFHIHCRAGQNRAPLPDVIGPLIQLLGVPILVACASSISYSGFGSKITLSLSWGRGAVKRTKHVLICQVAVLALSGAFGKSSSAAHGKHDLSFARLDTTAAPSPYESCTESLSRSLSALQSSAFRGTGWG